MTTPSTNSASPGKLALGTAIIIVVIMVSWFQRQQGGVGGTTAPVQQGSSTSAPTASTTDMDTVRVGSWNIEWLGKPDSRSGMAENIAQRPADLAKYIAASGVHALALQEVIATASLEGSPASGLLRSHELDAVLAELRTQSGDAWEYVLFPGRSEDAQLTGLAWNTAFFEAVDAAGKSWDDQDQPWRVPIAAQRGASRAGLWNRPPHAFKLRAGAGKTDVVLIVLHMKADYQGDFASQRNQEAEALMASLDQVRRTFKDQDIIILGDTNVTSRDEQTLDKFITGGFVDLNENGLQTHWRSGIMDRIFIQHSEPEFSDSTMEVISADFLQANGMKPADFKRDFSDHYMVVTTIRIMPDDD